MIRKILIEGVRTHERTEIELGRLTCLVGPNGSGKSTVLQSFEVLHGVKFPSWMRAGASEWIIRAVDDLENVAGAERTKTVVRLGGQEYLAVFVCRLDSEVLRTASESNVLPKLLPNGAQLAHVLANWKLSDESRFQLILNQLKKIVPTLENLRPHSTLIDKKPVFELFFDFRAAPKVPAQAVSEGTLLALGLLTMLHEVSPPQENHRSTVVLLDDIDRGLHPDAQLELIHLLRHLSTSKDLQIVMTTHSPYIVDALSPEEVCVLALDDSGTTRARKLSEIPGAERYQGMLSTGELWSSHGESWVVVEQVKAKSA